MRTNPSPSVRLAEHLLGKELETWVNEHRDAGASWDKIAADLYVATDTQVHITGEWLRRLYAPAPADGAA